jgi:hypothetical protein
MRRARLYFSGAAVLLPSSARSRRAAGLGERRPPVRQPHPPVGESISMTAQKESISMTDDQRGPR